MSAEYPDDIAAPSDPNAILRGAAMLIESALHSPPSPSHAEAASQERAVSAYQEWLTSPSALHSEPWRTNGSQSLLTKLTNIVRRLRGG